MSFSHAPTIDELLADGMIQAVMQADRVEPAELRTMLSGVADRIARRRQTEWKALRFFATPRLERRPDAESANARGRAFPAPVADACGAGLCC
jgi:hypothetical protein